MTRGKVGPLREALEVTRALLSGSEEHVAELTAEVKRLRADNKELREFAREVREVLKGTG